jgi:hypothetical protein
VSPSAAVLGSCRGGVGVMLAPRIRPSVRQRGLRWFGICAARSSAHCSRSLGASVPLDVETPRIGSSAVLLTPCIGAQHVGSQRLDGLMRDSGILASGLRRHSLVLGLMAHLASRHWRSL